MEAVVSRLDAGDGTGTGTLTAHDVVVSVPAQLPPSSPWGPPHPHPMTISMHPSKRTGFTTPPLALCADSKAGLKALVAHVSKQDSLAVAR